MASDVAGLQLVVATLEDLKATQFWGLSDCEHLAYERGSFIGNIDGTACIADNDSRAFDAEAAADHARVRGAFEASGADSRGVFLTAYDHAGTLTKARFVLENAPGYEFYEYLYDPNDMEEKVSETGSIEYTRINDDWWFIWSYFD